MPFDSSPSVKVFDPDGKMKYDLRTGKGRLLYLADQLEAKQPADFDMHTFDTCAAHCASKMKALTDLGLQKNIRQDKTDMKALARFFGIGTVRSMRPGILFYQSELDYLFGSYPRSVDQEVAIIREFVSRKRRQLSKVLA